MNLRRHAHSDVVHSAHCRHAANAERWEWARYQKWATIIEAIDDILFLRTCKVCDPMGLHRRARLQVIAGGRQVHADRRGVGNAAGLFR